MANIKTVTYNGTSYNIQGIVDATLTTSGEAADAKATGDAITAINAQIQGLSSVPTEVKTALYNLVSNAVYVDYDASSDKAVIASWASTSCQGISLSANTMTFSSITTQTLTATLIPADCTDIVIWSTSNSSIATVIGGVVTSVGNGPCVITASCGGYSATCSVTVSGLATTYTVTNSLTHCSTNNAQTSVEDGASYTATITANANYDLSSITVTMGGNDITGTAVSGNVISIASVTGAIVITATAVRSALTLIYDWDFTNNNLTDSVGGLVAETTATQGTNGITFDATAQYIVLNSSATMSLKSHAVEIDIVSMSDRTSQANHCRLLSVSTNSAYKTNTSAQNFMWRNTGGWYSYSDSGAWSSEHLDGSTYPGSYFRGKTIRLTFDSNYKLTVSVAGTELISYSVGWNNNAGYIVIGGSYADYLSDMAPTISGIRVYEVNE